MPTRTFEIEYGASAIRDLDTLPERLELAADKCHAETLNYDKVDVVEALKSMTGGRGPDACIDAVGFEAHGKTLSALYDEAKYKMYLATDRPNVLRQAIMACRKGGTVSIPGVYGGLLDKLPFGAAFAKGLTFKMGQTHVHSFMRPLLERIRKNEIDPSFLITHHFPLDQAAEAYCLFHRKRDGCSRAWRRGRSRLG